ncbi:DUF4397 domain-containing protein [Halobacterium yunchengense]|uniref:DUF4397 domain-containing protein n=1 Tax=Halobacterium yunchengense TaxID=3108497 RepID=UPI00300B801F
MGTPPSIDRRRFVALSGTALAAALAGCAGGDGDGGNGETPTETTAAPTETTAAETTGETTEQTTEQTETTEEPQGFLRAAHMSPDAPAVDVYVNDEPAFEGAEFTGVTPYAQLPPEEYDVRITAAGDEETVVFDEAVPVEAGYQTALAFGEVGADEGADTAFSVGLLADQAETSDDQAAVRLFHGSPDAPAVDVTVEGSEDVLFDGAAFGDTTDYATVEPGSYTLEVRPDTEDGTGDVVTTFDVSLESGTAYTGYAVGYLEPSGDQPEFDLATSIDGMEAQVR